ncbi:MAG: AAA family ATPase [Eubacteriaceae bacterium]|nr:AAA family ATPase [Eubacteriaceae bacterium]
MQSGIITMVDEGAYDWVAYYSEFADKLISYKSNRADLLALVNSAHVQTGLRSQFADSTDIDPFTVFGTFNKGISMSNRTALMKAYCELMDIKSALPTSFSGVPVLMNMMAVVAWNEQAASDVWELFYAAAKFADDPTDGNRHMFVKWYSEAIKHKGISWNLTMGLFWMRPYFYLNLDSSNRNFLLNGDDARIIGVESVSNLKQLPEAENYLKLVDLCRSSFSSNNSPFRSFPELSNSAWEAANANSQEQNESKAKPKFLQWFEPLVNALKSLQGSQPTNEVYKYIMEKHKLPDAMPNEAQRGQNKGKYFSEVDNAAVFLAYEGLLDNSVNDAWSLTEKGKSVDMDSALASSIYDKWARHKEAQESRSAEKRYWMYSPGENSRKWDEFYSNGIICIGWDKLGDLKKYPDTESIRQEMQHKYDSSQSYKHNSLVAWQFVHDMREGDIVFAKRGTRQLIGRGIVESGYVFMAERDEYKNIRSIRWTNNGTWEHPGQAVTKSLTDVTPYTEYVEKLELIFAEGFGPESEIKYESYSQSDFLDEAFFAQQQYENLLELLKIKKNIILQGAPGVGKTFISKRLAYSIIGTKDTSRVLAVQFHQSYSYEDFIMGYRPTETGFELAKGPFYSFCKAAEDDLEHEYFFIIDEINRGNLSKIFGELLMLIENDKRGEKLRLMYSNELFSVPSNVFIIGLMNTADRSIALIDYALRRRFAFFQMEPAFDSRGFISIIESSGNEKFAMLIERIKELNNEIEQDESLGEGFRIGHSYFMPNGEVTDYWLSCVINFEILPLLSEYWFDEKTKVESWGKKLAGILND